MKTINKLLKTKGIGYILLAFAAGVILLVMPAEKSEATETSSQSIIEYTKYIEERLSNMASDACGRKCSVMVNFEAGFSYSFASNQQLDQTFDENGTMISKSASKEYIIITNDGTESLVVSKEHLPEISSVAVVCVGGNEEDKEILQNLMTSLFDLDSESVSCIIC